MAETTQTEVLPGVFVTHNANWLQILWSGTREGLISVGRCTADQFPQAPKRLKCGSREPGEVYWEMRHKNGDVFEFRRNKHPNDPPITPAEVERFERGLAAKRDAAFGRFLQRATGENRHA